MKPITIVTKDKMGLLSDISYVLGKEKINIEAMDANAVGGEAVITLLVKNPDKARDVLKKNGFTGLEEDFLVVRLGNEPGALGQVTEELKKAKIAILQFHHISSDGKQALVAIKADKPRAAKDVLKSFLAEEL